MAKVSQIISIAAKEVKSKWIKIICWKQIITHCLYKNSYKNTMQTENKGVGKSYSVKQLVKRTLRYNIKIEFKAKSSIWERRRLHTIKGMIY